MKNNETGRSMVEMLGVLAIIGVLSVGGIAGYTMAMRKYKANEVLNTASMLTMLSKSANGGSGANMANLAAAGLQAPYGSVEMSSAIDANGDVTITITNAESGVCDAVNSSANNSLFTPACSD